ncbi:Scr1 family TA system antitoxin-like transcriptional regulator [Actinoplanes sp. NPDC051494]|uniref:Scr1 family TA system antitoxin-like transcriptional regulator n=1 Tax=Actinoplanes sp. NPDC051494 TaxID=3363907 RepID=UPI0037A2359C
MNDPDLQKWLLADDGLATRLRRLRGERTGRDVAAAADMRPAKLSKLELAQQTPTADDIRQITAALGADAGTTAELLALLEQMPSVRSTAEKRNLFGQAALQRRYNELFATASLMRSFDLTYVPRVLQTYDYARVVLADQARMQNLADESAAAASVVVQAGQVLRETPGQVRLLVAEPALRWQVAPAAAMRAQLAQLEAANDLGLQLRVLPLNRPLAVFPQNSFTLYDYLGYIESFAGYEKVTGERWARYNAVMDLLWDSAVDESQSRDLIAAAAKQLSR